MTGRVCAIVATALIAITTDGAIAQSPLSERSAGTHAFWGQPGGKCNVLDKVYYITCHDEAHRNPMWVMYELRTEQLGNSINNAPGFRADPDIAVGHRAESADYSGSGYDRGHLAPAADFTRSRKALAATYVLSNAAPENPTLNRGMWRSLEDQVRKLARDRGRAWIVTGVMYLDATGKPLDSPRTIGTNGVAVPSHFYKAVICEVAGGGHDTFAFLVPNTAPAGRQLQQFLTSVDAIEQIGGVDLFSALPDEEEELLEASTPRRWPVATP